MKWLPKEILAIGLMLVIATGELAHADGPPYIDAQGYHSEEIFNERLVSSSILIVK